MQAQGRNQRRHRSVGAVIESSLWILWPFEERRRVRALQWNDSSIHPKLVVLHGVLATHLDTPSPVFPRLRTPIRASRLRRRQREASTESICGDRSGHVEWSERHVAVALRVMPRTAHLGPIWAQLLEQQRHASSSATSEEDCHKTVALRY